MNWDKLERTATLGKSKMSSNLLKTLPKNTRKVVGTQGRGRMGK